MNRYFLIFVAIFVCSISILSFKKPQNYKLYANRYSTKLVEFNYDQKKLVDFIAQANLNNTTVKEQIKQQINDVRIGLKSVDFWLRYFDPISYRKINGPLPVEWETEVFEKFEKPYRREGAGLTLAALYLDEPDTKKDSLLYLLTESIAATNAYLTDSISKQLQSHHHFFLANRLFLLNLAAVYTTGFECPDTTRIIPELKLMLDDVGSIYKNFNESFTDTRLSVEFISLYDAAVAFVNSQPDSYTLFDHFTFLKDFVNPLFGMNQKLIRAQKVFSKSYVDYSLNNQSTSIFNKDIYFGQNTKGIFLRVTDAKQLAEIENIGRLLFYDPILSVNNQRSCNSCHKTSEFFTDTAYATSLQVDGNSRLARNTPTLINATYNHLLMYDGKHISLQNQAKDVIGNPQEMGCTQTEVLKKVMECETYAKAFKSFLKYTPQEKEVNMDHIVGAVTAYYNKFNNFYSPFDDAMNKNSPLANEVKDGFNLFMSKAQCGTCHFVPQFNGVKPPFIGSEFEVLGVPADTGYSKLSNDLGRYNINPSAETKHAFRTGTLRNAAKTKPYMHNGVFSTLQQVIDFYDGGGGAGRGLPAENQTLSSDSLRLTPTEKKKLISFINSLTENITFDELPAKLPLSKSKALNSRKPGGDY